MDWGQKGEKTRRTPNRANLDGERIEEDLARQNHVLLSLNCSYAWDRERDPADLRGLYASTFSGCRTRCTKQGASSH